MLNELITVTRSNGLHARPAAEFVKLAATFDSELSLEFNGETVDAKSIMSVMSLGLTKDSQVKLIATGDDQEMAFKVLKGFITANE